jgi:hypothetical protein
MPSAITHMLLVKNLLNKISDNRLKATLASGKYFLQIGAVGPDLPYSSIADGNLIFGDQSELADKFHYTNTNQLPILALSKIKLIPDTNTFEKRYAFNFIIGYISHIVADGIMHPFIRDKVGNYSENKTAHRILEMRLDVLMNNYFTAISGTPTEYNYTNIHDELKNISGYPEVNAVVKIFKESIQEIYNLEYEVDLILDWVNGLHRLLSIAEGEHPAIYRNLSILDGILYKNFKDLEDKKDALLVLEKPIDGLKNNFLHKQKVHFLDDCVPQFYRIFIPILEKAYNSVYNNGEELTENDIPPIDLDTGRSLLAANNMEIIPTLWS